MATTARPIPTASAENPIILFLFFDFFAVFISTAVGFLNALVSIIEAAPIETPDAINKGVFILN